jgi:hypothetical protein
MAISIENFPAIISDTAVCTRHCSEIDLRFESLRQRDNEAEKILLESIRGSGISRPLSVIVDASWHRPILIDGFKRYRCAVKLGIDSLPLQVIDGDEKTGLLLFLRHSRQKELTDLEYAALIDHLHKHHRMSLSRIASFIGCSVAWVCLRHGLIEQMGQTVCGLVMTGKLPLRCWLYAIRPFTRVKNVDRQMVERFAGAVAGRKLSTRQLFLLTQAYFTGSSLIRQHIEEGRSALVLAAIRNSDAADPREPALPSAIEDLQQARCGIDRVIATLPHIHSDDETMRIKGNLVAGAILERLTSFKHIVKEYYDRTGKAHGSAGDAPGRHAQTCDRRKLEDQHQNGTLDHCG